MTDRMRPLAIAVLFALLGALLLAAPGPVQGQATTCAGLDLAAIEVEGAEFSQARCLPDLSTAGNTFRTTGGGSRENPTLHSELTEFPPGAVPGLQVEGWFPDSCDRYEPEAAIAFMPTCDNGLRHNGQFVLRIPDAWDGTHLVVAGAPGIRDQYAQDPILSDWVLARGWAYIAHDRGRPELLPRRRRRDRRQPADLGAAQGTGPVGALHGPVGRGRRQRPGC